MSISVSQYIDMIHQLGHMNVNVIRRCPGPPQPWALKRQKSPTRQPRNSVWIVTGAIHGVALLPSSLANLTLARMADPVVYDQQSNEDRFGVISPA